MTKQNIVTGVFANADRAIHAIAHLSRNGISQKDISVVVAEGDTLEAFGIQKGSKAGQGAAIGGGIGGATGAVIAGLTAVGAIATGGLGLLAAGPIVAALAGAGAGAAAGGVLGGLIGMGIPEHQVKFFENALEKGSVLVGVQVDDQNRKFVEDTLKAFGADDAQKSNGRVAIATQTEVKPGVAPGTDVVAPKRPGLHNLLIDQLKDLYNAEKQLADFLPRMQEAAQNPKLAQAFADHLEETRGQVRRLEMVFSELGMEAEEEKCPAMTGILAEAKEMMKKMDTDHPEHDAALICAAQKVEHYEIGTYGCLVAYARRLGHSRAASLLEQTLAEERAADFALTEIAESEVNEMAVVSL